MSLDANAIKTIVYHKIINIIKLVFICLVTFSKANIYLNCLDFWTFFDNFRFLYILSFLDIF